MDIVGTFNHLIPSDQLEDSLLLGQNLECEASDEFASGHNILEDSLKNMLSDKDPMFGSASAQFHLLENDDANYQMGRGRGGHTRCPGPLRGVSAETPGRTLGRRIVAKPSQELPSSSKSLADSCAEKREALLSRRFNVHEVDPSMNPVVVLRRLTVTVGGYKIELLPGPSQTSGSFNTGTLQALSFQNNSVTTDSIRFDQAFTEEQAPGAMGELNAGQHGANNVPMEFGPYVNPNDVQDANGALSLKASTTEATADTKVSDQNATTKVGLYKSQNKNGPVEKPVTKKLLKPKQPLSITKNKRAHLTRPGVLLKGSKHLKLQDKKVCKATAENLQHVKGKLVGGGLKRHAALLTPKPASKSPQVQVGHPEKSNANSSIGHSAPTSRKASSDSSLGAKAGLNKPAHALKKPQNLPTAVLKPNQSAKDGPTQEEPEKAKIKKPEKILQRQKSRNSRSVSLDEPELFIPDNAPVAKKGPAEGEPPPAPENETAWDSSKQCGLCMKPHSNRFMVGCGRCDDWFHGDCVGLDLAKVQQMEKDDQEYVCLKCCANEGGKAEAQTTAHSDSKSPARPKHGAEPSVTSGGIRPFRKDSGDRRPSVDSVTKSGINVKQEVKKAKVSPASLKKPSTGQIRRSVRDSLEEILVKRLKESDMKVSSEKPAELAKRTEKELFALFQGVDSKYKNKYRSLTFNLKDTKNNVLFKRVLKGEISPRDLVRMSAEELASKELAAWRQRENRHTIEMIEKEQREAERRPVTKITHKGEIEIENEEPAKAPEAIEAMSDPVPKTVEVSEEKPPDLKAESPKKVKDTTSLHKSHLFDLHCKICTGRMAPPVEEATTKVVKVATTVLRRQSMATEGDNQQTTPISSPAASAALVDDLSLRAMEEGLLNSSIFPAYESSASNKEDTVTFLANLESLWNGYVVMPAVARFLTKAYPVSGILDHLTEDLPDSIQVGGRISPQIVWDYVEKIRASGTKEICVVRFTPDTEEDEISYTLLYAYFSSRRRYGVVANNRKQVKDMYLIPLSTTEKIPHQIVPFDGPGLETNRPNLLLGLIIRQRPKRDFGVILSSDVSEAPSFLPENKPQVDPAQKTVVGRDEERNFISTLGRIHKKDAVAVIKSTTDETLLEMEDDENVSLRFLPGVLTQPTAGKNPLAGDDGKSTSSSAVSHSSTADGSTLGSVTARTPTAPRLDRFIIKKKESKPVKTEHEPTGSSKETGLQGKEKESGVVFSLKNKPGDVSTEMFLSSLSTTQPKTESINDETKGDANAHPSQETNVLPGASSALSEDSANSSTRADAKIETMASPTKTQKPLASGILKKTSLSEAGDSTQLASETDVPQLKVTPAKPLSEFKAVEDIQTISTISYTGKNEGQKQSRPRLVSPTPFNTGGPFRPLAPPPFSYHPGPPPPMIFPQPDPQNQLHAPPWTQPAPSQGCFPQPVPEVVAGPPLSYTTRRFPDSTLPTPPPSSKGEKGPELNYEELWDRQPKRSEEPFKKDERDHYGRHRHKSRHQEVEKHRARSRSWTKSRSRSKSRSKSHSRKRHHSSHHKDKRRSRDQEKHRRDSRDRHS
uniref:PHD finger protein 3 n=1 Tax=Electrophorus electricus TaxID=8005 RepID=A0AAY5EJJ7_ELEEL